MTPAAKHASSVPAPVPLQLTVADLAGVFQCDARTIRKAIHKSPPEFTWYEKLGKVYFAPEDVLQAIVSSKHHAVRNGEGVITAVDAELLWGRIERFLRLIATENTEDTEKAGFSADDAEGADAKEAA